MRRANRIVGDPDTAEDIAQEALVRLLAVKRWKHPRHPRALYLATVDNLARNHRRDTENRRRLLRATPPPTRPPPTPLERLLLRAGLERLASAIATLPDRQREVVRLCAIEGLSYTEIGRMLGLSPGTVANDLWKARRSLRRVWETREG